MFLNEGLRRDFGFKASNSTPHHFVPDLKPFEHHSPSVTVSSTSSCQDTHVWRPQVLKSQCGERHHSKENALKGIVSKFGGNEKDRFGTGSEVHEAVLQFMFMVFSSEKEEEVVTRV